MNQISVKTSLECEHYKKTMQMNKVPGPIYHTFNSLYDIV